MDFNNNKITYPKSLYEISLGAFCEFLNRCSKSSTNKISTESKLSSSFENHPINLIFSSHHSRTPQWMLSSRPSSTDNLACNNFDDKLNTFKKSCHNLIGTFFGRKSYESLEEENEVQQNDIMKPSYDYFRITENICGDILLQYQQNYKINDRTLSLPFFDGEITPLKCFEIEDANQITASGLKFLNKHNLIRLKMGNLTNCTITELINNLSSWSISNLEAFSIPYCSLTKFNKICIILSLTRLTHLLHLDVSNTSFNNQCLEIITDHLENLRSLNLTSTKITILKPLLKLIHLKNLNLHNVAVICKDESIIGELNKLEILDISDERFVSEALPRNLNDHLQTYFPKFFDFAKLTELDISGRDVSPSLVLSFVRHKIHQHQLDREAVKPLKFLGLVQTKFSFTQMIELDLRTKRKMILTGDGKFSYLMQSLIRYKHCSAFINETLKSLCRYNFPNENPSPEDDDQRSDYDEIDCDDSNINDREDFDEYDDSNDIGDALADQVLNRYNNIPQKQLVNVINLVLNLMEAHLENQVIVLFSTGILYKSTKNYSCLNSFVLKRVVDVCIEALKQYSTEYHITKNIMMIMCSERILLDITFNRCACIRLAMDSLFTFRDLSINRLALGICVVLAGTIPNVENVLMASQSVYLKRLLDLVQESSVNTASNEIILQLSLSALWNFTDEAPKTCETFIKHSGIDLYIKILMVSLCFH